MDRLAVFTLRSAPERFVLVLSDPRIAEAGTIVAAPLLDPDRFPIASGLNPILELDSGRFALATEQMAAISVKDLGQQAGTCVAYEYLIANAINRLFFGI